MFHSIKNIYLGLKLKQMDNTGTQTTGLKVTWSLSLCIALLKFPSGGKSSFVYMFMIWLLCLTMWNKQTTSCLRICSAVVIVSVKQIQTAQDFYTIIPSNQSWLLATRSKEKKISISSLQHFPHVILLSAPKISTTHHKWTYPWHVHMLCTQTHFVLLCFSYKWVVIKRVKL